MPLRYLIRCLLYPSFILAVMSSCQTLHCYRPLAVLVRDAETKQPIPEAELLLSYPLTRPSQAPYNSRGLTGQDGVARLRAAPFGEYGALVEGEAKGYLSDHFDIS